MSDRLRRWLVWALVAVVAASISTFLGLWQYSRYESKAANIALVEANFNAEPVPLPDIFKDGSFQPTVEWLPVSVTGSFIGEPVILPQRGIPGQAGDHVLSLFVTEDDEPQTLVIDRGWYPVSHPPSSLDAPSGVVTLIGRARPSEPASTRGVRDHQVFAVEPTQVIQAQSDPHAPNIQRTMYLMAEADAPGQEDLGSFPQPASDLGNHLSYAFQWWIFAAGAFVGLGVVIYRDVKDLSQRPTRKTKRVSTDIAEEDALIDAQLSN